VLYDFLFVIGSDVFNNAFKGSVASAITITEGVKYVGCLKVIVLLKRLFYKLFILNEGLV